MEPKIEIRQRCVVRASAPSSLIVRCTIGDRILQTLAVPVAFYFRAALDEAALRAGLERALALIPLFAGRLRVSAGALEIACDNTGVEWTSCEVPLLLDDVIARSRRGEAAWLIDMVDPPRARSARAPLLTVRCSHLSDGATVLGLCWHHSVGDMHSFMLLLRAWSIEVEGKGERPEVVLLEDREAHLAEHVPPGGTEEPGLRELSLWELARFFPYMAFSARRKRMVQTHYRDDELRRMRKEMSQQAGKALTANDVVCAQLMEVVSGYDALGRDRALAIAVNFRRRAGLHPGLVGNMVAGLRISCSTGEAAVPLAAKIRDGVTSFAERHMDYHSTMRWVAARGGPARLARCIPIGIDPLRRSMMLTNWSNFGVYEVVFGGQRPVFFTPGGEVPFPWLGGLVEGPNNEGLLLSAVLPTALAARLASPEGQARLHPYASAQAT